MNDELTDNFRRFTTLNYAAPNPGILINIKEY